MSELSRRRFLEFLCAGLATMAWAPSSVATAAAVPSKLRRVLGFGRAHINGSSEYAYFASVADPAAATVTPMEIPFFGHGCNFFPDAPHLAYVFEKRGHGCCVIDWQAGEVVRTVPSLPGREFYGHGAFSPDGEHIYVAEIDEQSKKGLVAVLDASGRELGTFPTYGSRPHDMRLIDEGRILVVGNAGGPLSGEAPSVAYVDVATHKLIERTGPTDPEVNIGHIALGAKGDLVMVSAPREGLSKSERGGVAMRLYGAPPIQMPSSPDISGMVGEALSICIDEQRRLVAVTHPSGDLLTIWDMDALKLRATLSLKSPRGLAHAGDGQHLVVSHGTGTLGLLSWSSLKMVRDVPLRITPFSGSHLYSLPA